MSKEIREQIDRVRNWNQSLNESEIPEWRLSYFPIGKFSMRLMESVRKTHNVKYHDSGLNHDTFDINAVNFNMENGELHVSFLEKIKNQVEPIIMNFFNDENKALKQFQQERSFRFIGEFDDIIVYPSGPNYGKKIITLKFDY